MTKLIIRYNLDNWSKVQHASSRLKVFIIKLNRKIKDSQKQEKLDKFTTIKSKHFSKNTKL